MKIIPDSRIRNIVSKGPKYSFLPKSISIDIGKNLHLLLMILVIDGVNERVLSVML